MSRNPQDPPGAATFAAGEDKAIRLRGDAGRGEAAGIHQQLLRQRCGNDTVLEVGE